MKNGLAKDGAQAFLDLLEPIERELETYCTRMVWASQDARDVLHNALVRAIQAFARFQRGSNFRAWMYRIVTREALTANRKYSRIAAREFQMEPEELASFASTEIEWTADAQTMESIFQQLDQELVSALRMLTNEERAALLLRAIGDLTYLEIAEALEMPIGSVIGYLGRARKKMRLAVAARRGRA
jgi:RNA polymerase sigma-70 factor, ECF subfamily